MKKAQLTLVMAIIIVILIIMGLVVGLESAGILNLVPNTQTEVGSYINDCLALTTQESLQVLGKNGGYKNPRNPLQFQQLSVLFENGQSVLASRVEFERRLSDLVKDNLKSCLDFNLFKGYEIINEGEITADTTITRDEVVVVLNYPLTIRLGENERSFNTFATRQRVKLFSMLENAEHIINHQIKERHVIDITPLKADHQIFISEREGHLIISMHDPKYIINKKPFKFQFAI